MVGLVPGQKAEDIPQSEFLVAKPIRKRLRRCRQVVIAEAPQRRQQVLARLGEYAANVRRHGNVVVGRASPSKPRNQLGKLRPGTWRKSLRGKQLFGNAQVHELPGDVSPSRSGSPAQRAQRVRLLLDLVQRG